MPGSTVSGGCARRFRPGNLQWIRGWSLGLILVIVATAGVGAQQATQGRAVDQMQAGAKKDMSDSGRDAANDVGQDGKGAVDPLVAPDAGAQQRQAQQAPAGSLPPVPPVPQGQRHVQTPPAQPGSGSPAAGPPLLGRGQRQHPPAGSPQPNAGARQASGVQGAQPGKPVGAQARAPPQAPPQVPGGGVKAQHGYTATPAGPGTPAVGAKAGGAAAGGAGGAAAGGVQGGARGPGGVAAGVARNAANKVVPPIVSPQAGGQGQPSPAGLTAKARESERVKKLADMAAVASAAAKAPAAVQAPEAASGEPALSKDAAFFKKEAREEWEKATGFQKNGPGSAPDGAAGAGPDVAASAGAHGAAGGAAAAAAAGRAGGAVGGGAAAGGAGAKGAAAAGGGSLPPPRPIAPSGGAVAGGAGAASGGAGAKGASVAAGAGGGAGVGTGAAAAAGVGAAGEKKLSETPKEAAVPAGAVDAKAKQVGSEQKAHQSLIVEATASGGGRCHPLPHPLPKA